MCNSSGFVYLFGSLFKEGSIVLLFQFNNSVQILTIWKVFPCFNFSHFLYRIRNGGCIHLSYQPSHPKTPTHLQLKWKPNLFLKKGLLKLGRWQQTSAVPYQAGTLNKFSFYFFEILAPVWISMPCYNPHFSNMTFVQL